MKSTIVRLSTVALCTAASTSLFAQTGTAAHRATSTVHRPSTVTKSPKLPGCATVPTLSAKIPALPPGVSCPKVLYSITSSAGQLSPMLSPQLKESLEKLNQSFYMAYVDTKVGTGPVPAAKMYYTVNYTGYLTDGTKFDSSEGKDPITFPYGAHRVIQGWDTGFEGMHVGGKRRLFVPYQLAYGDAGRPPVIPAKAELIFDVELVAQSEQPPAPKTPPTPPPTPLGATGTTGTTGVTGSMPAAVPATPAPKPATPPSLTGSTGPKQ